MDAGSPATASIRDNGIRVVVLEDEPLYLDLLRVSLVRYPHIHVVGTFADGPSCVQGAPDLHPQVALLDIELPGGMYGIEVGLRLREQLPDLGMVILSNHRDPAFVAAIRQGTAAGWSYLLKSSVTNVEALMRAVVGAATGLVVLDQALVQGSEPRPDTCLSRLTSRKREILELIAQGYTNAAIAEQLEVSRKTVENHINLLYQELEIDHATAFLPRVLAVLAYIDQSKMSA